MQLLHGDFGLLSCNDLYLRKTPTSFLVVNPGTNESMQGKGLWNRIEHLPGNEDCIQSTCNFTKLEWDGPQNVV